MNLPFYIAKRISGSSKGSFSHSINRIAVASVGLGLAVMIIAYLTLMGFKDTISEKVYSLSAHLQVSKYVLNNSLLEEPISAQANFYQYPDSFPYIAHVQRVAYKGALLKTEAEVQGVVLKGIDAEYDSTRFKQHLVEGRYLNLRDSAYQNEVLISRKISRLLRLSLDEDITLFFIQNPPRFRKMKVVGIYDTGLEDFDDQLLLTDLRLHQRLNNWGDSLVGGYEIFVKDLKEVNTAEVDLFERIDPELLVQKVSEKYIQVFDWLYLLNRNVVIFLGLILFVACFNMVSIIFILIMERTQMIGMLKALGANNGLIRKVFVYNGLVLVLKGLLWGNGIGLLFGFVQYYFKLIPLDPENYYMSHVPIGWDWSVVLILNVLTLLVVSLVLFMPTFIISRLKPIKAIKFD
ncbi:FtsX-like permease family protein [Cytophagales bacterium LB-30]|uniref:FtsX-like permease family protein n=1 Tax=Shiella aurantiaca TaxID=3058365 RepID=A0ABT8F423_9BACT|nr:FtsX-like permease family protein [Shiella aurantiaca]MDN4164966.1 FtsX-like permease family protein [Shiella aurantiaca]